MKLRPLMFDHHVFKVRAIRFFDKRLTVYNCAIRERRKRNQFVSLIWCLFNQQISDIGKNKETSMKFADIFKTSERVKRKLLKVAHDEQLDKALYVWFIQQRTSGTPISGPPNDL